MIRLELILVHWHRYRAILLFYMWTSHFPHFHLLKCFLFSSLWFWYLCQILSDYSCMYIRSTLKFFTCVYYSGRTILVVLLCLGNLSWDLESNSSSIVIFCSNVFGTVWLPFSFFVKEKSILMVIALNT